MLDDSIQFQKHTAKWTKNTPKMSKADKDPTDFLV